jgi:hypothetical protein
MSTPHLGLLCGVVFGLLSVALMIPLRFPDKRAAMTAAFLNRFGIGVCMGLMAPGRIGWATGLFLGVLLSLPDAIVTKAYAPILVVGALGGTVIGWVLSRFGV